MNELIAILDDEKDIVNLISINAKKNNYKVIEFNKSESLMKFLKTERVKPDLIILDIMLPDIDGFEVCKMIRNDPQLKNIPIIMLTAKIEETDKLIGLELGADDYITKPFSIKELFARIKVIFRRRQNNNNNIPIININNEIFIDSQKFEVYDINNNKIELTTTEFKIFRILVEKTGWVFTRDKLIEELHGIDKVIFDRTIDVHIKHLREKLGKYADLIETIKGVGYRFKNIEKH